MSTTFILNDKTVTTDCAPGMLALDYLRKVACQTGTKEGCKEGDCGACTVLVGELADGGDVAYRPMTSCLIPLGELEGKHLVSIEGINLSDLSPVQKAIVEEGGTQCGYCTPGFVVSMTGYVMDGEKTLDADGLKYAWSGNLCRCTGYRALKATLPQLQSDFENVLSCDDRVKAMCAEGFLPSYFEGIGERLKTLQQAKEDKVEDELEGEDALVIAGGTDLYVQRGESIPDQPVRLLNASKEIPRVVKEDGIVVADAALSFEAFATDPLVLSMFSRMPDYNLKIASWPVRTRATLGGNLINASPIADMTSIFMALDAGLVFQRAGQLREVALKDFYLGYKTMDMKPGERLRQIRFRSVSEEAKFNWEKVSKREGLDIATVNSGALFEVKDGVIESAHISMGGVAAVPLYLKETSAFLVGKPLQKELLSEAIASSQKEFEPIGDIRGSAFYKRLLARQFMIAHFTKLFPEVFALDETLLKTA